MAKKMEHPFRQRLAQGAILADGGMGTYLHAKGAGLGKALDELNLTDPQLVAAVHDEYIAAGAELIETNSYGASRAKLKQHGLDKQVREINIKAARIARERREIAGKEIFVAGSIGPLGKAVGSYGGISRVEAEDCFAEQAESLLEGGVDLFIVETFSDLKELKLAAAAIRRLCDLPVIGQVTITDDLTTSYGDTPPDLVAAAAELKLDVIGANCSVGPQRIFDFLMILHNSTDVPLSAQPNAGLPRYHEGRFFYVSSPDYFRDYCKRFLNLGVAIIGGCCGTRPEHIKAMHEVFASFVRDDTESATVTVAPPPQRQPPPAARTFVSDFAAKLGNQFVVSVEIDPPKGVKVEKVLRAARKLKEAGVDAVNIADSPMARVRMSCIAASALVLQQVGMEIILHFTCRDRNLMGLQSDLIGAHALGIHNVLAVTGDPPSMGDYPNATAVYDVDSIGLVEIISRLNSGTDLMGNSIGSGTHFSVGVAVNPTADDLEHEINRLEKKVQAGAQFAMTQPLYDLDVLEELLRRIRHIDIPILLGLLPLQSYRHAEFLHYEVPGIEIPQQLRDRLQRAGKDAAECGVAASRELLDRARQLVPGVYLMPSFGRYETVLQVLH